MRGTGEGEGEGEGCADLTQMVAKQSSSASTHQSPITHQQSIINHQPSTITITHHPSPITQMVAKLEPVKSQYPGISYADLYTLAGATAIGVAGVPVPWKAGRVDAMSPDAVTPDGRLPDASKGNDPQKTAKALRFDVFYRMGFDDAEIVALSGALSTQSSIGPRSRPKLALALTYLHSHPSPLTLHPSSYRCTCTRPMPPRCIRILRTVVPHALHPQQRLLQPHAQCAVDDQGVGWPDAGARPMHACV